ncbi:MAG TPA: hypothetical protein VIJ51_13630 [Solirubrobacteraceae bacterium]
MSGRPDGVPDRVALRRQAHVMRLREALDVALEQRDAAAGEAAAGRRREAELTERLASATAGLEQLTVRRTETLAARGADAGLIDELQDEVARLRGRSPIPPEELDWLRGRAETLAAVESGGWWRLRGRLLPLLRLAQRLRVAQRLRRPR